MDKEWAHIKAIERKEAVDRAHRMRFFDTDRVRKLHAEFLESAVHGVSQGKGGGGRVCVCVCVCVSNI